MFNVQYEISDDVKLCRLGRRPVKQGPRHQLGNRGWVNLSLDGAVKSATGGGGEEGGGTNKWRYKLAEFMKIGTWNSLSRSHITSYRIPDQHSFQCSGPTL